MNYPSREHIEHLREKYPVGSRIQLNELNDPYSKFKPGEAGTLMFIDDIGTYPTPSGITAVPWGLYPVKTGLVYCRHILQR